MNPFLENPDALCSNGMISMVGTNLTSISLVMKFANHLAEMQDIELLYKITKQANLPYKMVALGDYVSTLKYPNSILRKYVSHKKNFKINSVMTTRGICYAWNEELSEKVFDKRFSELSNESFQNETKSFTGKYFV